MTDFSPAAQAVISAAVAVNDLVCTDSIAAALRAAADQVVPQRLEIYRDEAERIDGDVRSDVRQDLLAIAAELEGSDD